MDSHILQLGSSLKEFFIFKYMPIRDDSPHRLSQILLNLFDFINKIEKFDFIHIKGK